jgi:hypothetical protein
MKPIAIDIDDLALARNQHNSEFLHVLDLRNGRIHLVEEFGSDLGDEPALEDDDDQDWPAVDDDEPARDLDVAADDELDDGDDADDDPEPPSQDDVPTARDIRTYPQLYLLIEPREEHTALHDMEEFVETLAEGEPRRALARALRLPRPFRSFKDTLYDFPDERDAWFSFSEERQRADALEWLSRNGVNWSNNGAAH